MSKKRTLTLTIEFGLSEERGDLVIGEIPADELPALFFQRKITVSLNDGPERQISARQARWVMELIDELKDSVLTQDGQTAL